MIGSIDRRMSVCSGISLLISRVLIAALFLVACFNKFRDLNGATINFTRLGLPVPSAMAPLIATIELAFVLLLLIGYQVRSSAIAVALFCVISGLIAHTNFGDVNQLNNFLKNLAIAGGALALFVSGGGSYSLDAWRQLRNDRSSEPTY
jgi:putative oxidoreductase